MFQHPRSLHLSIEVLEELEDAHHPASVFGFDNLRNLHIYAKLNVDLRKFQDKVHLVFTPYAEYWKD